MNLQQMRERATRVRNVPLRSVLLAVGAGPDRYDKAKWHTEQGVISVTGMKFFNWNLRVGGGGAIDLVIHLNDIGFQDAVAWLCQHFPTQCFSVSDPSDPKPQLHLPTPNTEELPRVKRYLADLRGIPPVLLDQLAESGKLYADNRANAVFLLLGKQNRPVGAELRGTSSRPWRGMAPGSRKDIGFFSVGTAHSNAFILCESAIDAISCFTINPHLGCISTAGARPSPCWLPDLLRHRQQVYCGFDADPTGDAMAHSMIDLHPAVKRHRPTRHDWNDALTTRR